MKINRIQTTSFKAQLLTKPEQFFCDTDSDDDKKYIRDVFAMTEMMLGTKQVSKFTPNDTIEFKRNKNKKKQISFKIIYKTPDIKENDINKKIFENIRVNGPSLRSTFYIQDIFDKITYAVAYKRGIFKELSPFATKETIRDRAFEYTEEQSKNFPF